MRRRTGDAAELGDADEVMQAAKLHRAWFRALPSQGQSESRADSSCHTGIAMIRNRYLLDGRNKITVAARVHGRYLNGSRRLP
jgi:hypothetical protein